MKCLNLFLFDIIIISYIFQNVNSNWKNKIDNEAFVSQAIMKNVSRKKIFHEFP